MERIDMMWEPVRVILVQIGEFFPRVLLAILILVLGWLLCRAAQRGDEQPTNARVIPLERERHSAAAGR